MDKCITYGQSTNEEAVAIIEAKLPISAPEGLRVLLNVLSPQRELDLINAIEQLPGDLWTHPQPHPTLPPAKRHSIAFGWHYSGYTRRLARTLPLPAFLIDIRECCARAGGFAPELFTQATIARYDPPAGIGHPVAGG